MTLFFRVFQHLLPDSLATRIRLGSAPWKIGDGSRIGDPGLVIGGNPGRRTIDRFFHALAAPFVAARSFVDGVYGDLFAADTRELTRWELQFGLTRAVATADRRSNVDAAWRATGGQSPRYLQDIVQSAGFDVYLHEWWQTPIPYDPRAYTILAASIGTVQCGEPLAQCGEPSALCDGSVAVDVGYLVNGGLSTQAPPAVPSNPATWPYFLYWGGETFGARAEVLNARRQEFERLLLKLCPAEQWLVTMVDYVDAAAEPPASMTWTSRVAGSGYSGIFAGAAHNGTITVIVGGSGEIQTSTDGVIWTRRANDGSYAGAFQDVVWDGSQFIVVGTSGGTDSEIQTSPDGITWTSQAAISGGVYCIAYGGGLFVTGGPAARITTSPDGVTWTSRTAAGTDSFVGLAASASLFVAVGVDGAIESSPDGITWTSRTAADGYAGSFYGVTWTGLAFVATGDAGTIQTSTDGITWVSRTAADGYANILLGGASSGSSTLSLGLSGAIQLSDANGVTWTTETQADGFAGFFYRGVWTGDQYIVVGSGGTIQTGTPLAA